MGLVLVCALLAGSGAAATVPGDAAGSASVAATPASAVEADAWYERDSPGELRSTDPTAAVAAQVDNESTSRHQDPSRYDEGGDQEALASWFERRFADRLGDSAVELSEGQYDLASDAIGESFQDQFGEYVDVAGETGREERAERIESTRDAQQNLTEARREYEETRQRYERARDAGEEERARELARELETLSRNINESSATVVDNYRWVQNETGTDLQEPLAVIEAVNREVQSTQASIRDAEFEETRLSVRRTDGGGPISFVDPMRVTGTLSTAAGEPIGDERIRLAVGNRVLRQTSNADGSFSITYRPLTIPASTEAIRFAYAPPTASTYLGSSTSIPVSVEPVEATVDPPTVDASSVAFGDEVGVGSAVTVDGEPVGSLPVAVRIGDRTLATGETAPNGSLSGAVSIPATIPDGERELTVAFPADGRAIRAASASTPLSVVETSSSLSVSARRTGSGDIALNGSLTAAGTGVAGRSISISVGEETVTTATTGSNGDFETRLPLDAASERSVTATFDGSGTNLEPARASTVVAASGSGADGGIISEWLLPIVAVGVVGIATALGGRWWLRRHDTAGDGAAGSIGVADPDVATRATVSTRSAPETLLSRAADALGDGRPDDAVRAAYVAVRRRLDDVDDRTHWEFYRAYAAADGSGDAVGQPDDADDRSHDADGRAGDGSGADDGGTSGEPIGADELRTLTAAYERAAFGPESTDRQTAERILSRARAACDVAGDTEPGSGGSADRHLDAGSVASGDD